MSKPDNYFEPANIRGNVDLPVLFNPRIRGNVHRSDPDGSHAQPYFAGLAGTSLALSVGVAGGAVTPITVNFVTNFYSDAVAAVNAASPTNISWLESDGFACIQNLHGGGKNYLIITGGTAAPILGLPVDPFPGSYSQAGDLESAPGDRRQLNNVLTELLAHDENLSSRTVNRAIFGALLGVFQKLNDLDKEFVTYVTLPATQFATGGAVPSNTVKLANFFRLSSQALLDQLAHKQRVTTVLTNDPYPVPLYDASGNVVTVLGTSYGASDVVPEVNAAFVWGTPPNNPGANLLGTSAMRSFKVPLTNITSVSGNIIKAPGALFVTNNAQVGDQITIRGATNDSPFNHNGVFVITTVFDENTLSVRPLGSNERPVNPNDDTPPALNPTLSSFSYGQIAVYVGPNITMTGKTGVGQDAIFFRLSATLTVGQSVMLRLPVTTTLRQCLGDEFLSNTAFDQDPQIAYQNKANIFQRIQEFVKGIQLDELDAFGTTARVLAPAHLQTAGYNLMWSTEGVDQGGGSRITTRLYATTFTGNLAGFVFTTNARLDNAGNWNKDVTGVAAYRFLFFSGVFTVQGRLAASNAAWTDGAGWDAASSFKYDIIANLLTLLSDLAMTGNAAVSGTVDVGSGLRNTGTGIASLIQAETSRIKSTLPNSITGDATLVMTLISDWIVPTGEHYRIYAGRGNKDFRFTINALWNGPAIGWNSDDNASASFSYRMGSHFVVQRKAATAAFWAEGNWDATPIDIDMVTANDPINVNSRIATSLGLNSFIDMVEVADPAAPAATHGRFYLRSNGLVTPNHRTQVVVMWADGSTVVIAESPAS